MSDVRFESNIDIFSVYVRRISSQILLVPVASDVSFRKGKVRRFDGGLRGNQSKRTDDQDGS